jgi:hypothetical protein
VSGSTLTASSKEIDRIEVHLRGVLKAYASYYNEIRTHLSLDKNAPDFRRTQTFGRIAARPIHGGLHHQYVRV